MSTVPAARKRLRIAVLNRTFVSTGGGAERYSIALVEELSQRHEIHVFAQTIEHQWPGVTYHKLWTPLVKPRWINQLWYAATSWWATRQGFDVVHSHENSWHGQVQTVHVLPVKYSLFQGRGGWQLALRWLKVVTSPRLLTYLWLEKTRYANRRGRCVVATSPSLGAIMAQTYPSVVPAMKIIAPGVSHVPGPASVNARREARVRLGLPTEGLCILFVGNDYRKKGLVALVDALRQLPSNIFLAVVGNASQIPLFKEQVKSSGLEARIHFLGSQKEMSDVYIAADCLAHPTQEDTFAMVVLEALAYGLPVVVSGPSYCGISGLFQNGREALILDNPHNSIELANAIEKILTNTTLKDSLTQAGVAFARSYLWSEIAAQQEQVYLCAGNSSAGD